MIEQFLKTGPSVANFVLCLHENRTGYLGGRKAIKIVMQVVCPLTLEGSQLEDEIKRIGVSRMLRQVKRIKKI